MATTFSSGCGNPCDQPPCGSEESGPVPNPTTDPCANWGVTEYSAYLSGSSGFHEVGPDQLNLLYFTPSFGGSLGLNQDYSYAATVGWGLIGGNAAGAPWVLYGNLGEIASGTVINTGTFGNFNVTIPAGTTSLKITVDVNRIEVGTSGTFIPGAPSFNWTFSCGLYSNCTYPAP